MDERERIAHHEAAHAVLSIKVGLTVADRGIDLDHPTSSNTSGVAAINLYVYDPNAPEQDQRWDLVRNLIAVCAGAASDAKILGGSLRGALTKQSGDEGRAFLLMNATPLFGDKDSERLSMQETVLEDCLARAEKDLSKPEIWDLVQAVAMACITNGGKLSKLEIDQIVEASNHFNDDEA